MSLYRTFPDFTSRLLHAGYVYEYHSGTAVLSTFAHHHLFVFLHNHHEFHYRGYCLGDPVARQHSEPAHQARGYNHLL